MQTVRFTSDTQLPKRESASISPLLLGIIAIFFTSIVFPAAASAETRTLRMYFTHTKKSATITFKKNGRYVRSGLRKANKFLGDWRRKESTKMDRELLDLVWEVYQRSGSRKPIHVISGYRSPRTNNMLRRRGRKVARNSQHTRGKALDFFMPDVSVKKLRALGLKAHRGGVGYYRGSFVHLDTGNVRHWPRMSRRQLARVFPRGKTIHVPSNGKPLRGYKVAKANLKRGLMADGKKRRTAVRRSLLAQLFSRSTARGGDEDEGAAVARKPVRASAKPAVVAKKPKKAPKPKKPGVDPFAAEAKRVEKLAKANEKKRLAEAQKKAEAQELANKKKLEADRLKAEEKKKQDIIRKEKADEAKAIALAAAAEEALKKQQEQVELAALVPSRVIKPRRRPELRTTTLALAPADASTLNAQTAANATELALAKPSEAPRPAVNVGEVSKRSQDIEALRDRVQTALVSPEDENLLVPVKNAPLPTAAKRTTVAETDLKLPAVAPKQSEKLTIPVPRLAESKLIDEPVVQASLQNEIDAPKPSWRLPTEESANAVPTPVVSPALKAKRRQANSRAIAIEDGQAMRAELTLGDLDGRSVKSWAVAASTRIGSSAVLSAPNYRESTKRAAPASVYSVGFEDATSPLRADRFSGRALTRVAFANFGTNQ